MAITFRDKEKVNKREEKSSLEFSSTSLPELTAVFTQRKM